jgi:hypothetical protein
MRISQAFPVLLLGIWWPCLGHSQGGADTPTGAAAAPLATPSSGCDFYDGTIAGLTVTDLTPASSPLAAVAGLGSEARAPYHCFYDPRVPLATPPSGTGYNRPDWWWAIPVPANGVVWLSGFFSDQAPYALAFYTGNPAAVGGLALRSCTNHTFPSLYESGLVPGSTLFLRYQSLLPTASTSAFVEFELCSQGFSTNSAAGAEACNLLHNPNLESNIGGCIGGPYANDRNILRQATGWNYPTSEGTTDYQRLPGCTNGFGYSPSPPVNPGTAGLIVSSSEFDFFGGFFVTTYRELLSATLQERLKCGRTYHISCTARNNQNEPVSFCTDPNELQLRLYSTPPSRLGNTAPPTTGSTLVASLATPLSLVSWTTISNPAYVATGNERYLCVGNWNGNGGTCPQADPSEYAIVDVDELNVTDVTVLTLTATQPSLPNCNNGSISLNIPCPDYTRNNTYQWLQGATVIGTGTSIAGLSPGTYTLRETDPFTQCIKTASVTLAGACPLDANTLSASAHWVTPTVAEIRWTWPDGLLGGQTLVERTYGLAPGSNTEPGWAIVGTLPGTEALHYRLEDAGIAPTEPVVAYRLQLQLANGSRVYSPVLELRRMAASTQPLSLNLQPNPAQGGCWVTVKGAQPGDYRLRVHSALSQTVLQTTLPGPAVTMYLDANAWAPGLYLVEVTDAFGTSQLQRLLVQP